MTTPDDREVERVARAIVAADPASFRMVGWDNLQADVRGIAYKLARAAIAAMQPAGGEGWVTVPRVPTEGMVREACSAIESADTDDCEPGDPRFFWGYMWQSSARDAWSAMIAAAPSPGSGGEG